MRHNLSLGRHQVSSGAESDGVIGRESRVASEKRGPTGLVVRVRVRVLAALLCERRHIVSAPYLMRGRGKRGRRTEVGVVSNTGRGARLSGVVRARAAVRAVRYRRHHGLAWQIRERRR